MKNEATQLTIPSKGRTLGGVHTRGRGVFRIKIQETADFHGLRPKIANRSIE